MCVYLCSWSHWWLYLAYMRHIYWYSCLTYAHELIVTCGLYVAFKGCISFVHVCCNNMFPVTWCWWCKQWHHYISHWDDCWKVFCDFCVNASTGDGMRVMCHWQCCWCHVVLIPMASHDQKSHVAPDSDSWPKNTMVPLAVSLVSWDAKANGLTWQKVMLCLILIVLTKGMQWCNWQCHWHHRLPVPVVSHRQKSHRGPHFNHLHLGNAMGPLKMVPASNDADGNASGIMMKITIASYDQKRKTNCISIPLS